LWRASATFARRISGSKAAAAQGPPQLAMDVRQIRIEGAGAGVGGQDPDLVAPRAQVLDV